MQLCFHKVVVVFYEVEPNALISRWFRKKRISSGMGINERFLYKTFLISSLFFTLGSESEVVTVKHFLSTYVLIVCKMWRVAIHQCRNNSRCDVRGGPWESLVVSKYSHFGLTFKISSTSWFVLPFCCLRSEPVPWRQGYECELAWSSLRGTRKGCPRSG